MKKTLALALAAGFAAQSFAAGDVLVLAAEGTYPPFSEIKDGKMTGFDIDIGLALCAEMKRECRFEQIDWEALIPALKTKKIDVIVASMNDTAERRESVAFTDPYYTNPGIFVRAKGSSIEPTPEGVKGKNVGVLRASIFDNYVTDKFPDANIRRYTGQEEANLDAVAGRVDLLFADKVVMEEGFLQRDEGKDFEAVGPEENDKKYFGEGISIAVRKEDNRLREDLNAALKAIRANGEYKKVNDKYFKYDVSGGTAK